MSRDVMTDLPNTIEPHDLNRLIELRRTLHRYPEISNQEVRTADRVVGFLEETGPDRIVRGIGGEGVAALYRGREDGPIVMIRCELDALPIRETNDSPHRSSVPDVSHKCGHDGHMAIVSGLALLLGRRRPGRGGVLLLYQPAEETGEGAARVLADPKFGEIEPDLVYTLHNLPGYPSGTVLLREGIIASASKGLIVRLVGAPSHAAHPDEGKNPALAACQILQGLVALPATHTAFGHSSLITPIHLRVGQPAFGTSAGEGVVMVTLRSHRNDVMEKLCSASVEFARGIAAVHGLGVETTWTEEFPAVVNNSDCVEVVREAARRSGLPVIPVDVPFSWSEDFGRFTLRYPGALFGLGAGEEHPQLHTGNYDFPDELITKGIDVFHGLVRLHCG